MHAEVSNWMSSCGLMLGKTDRLVWVGTCHVCAVLPLVGLVYIVVLTLLYATPSRLLGGSYPVLR